MWTIKRIDEADFGCEERLPGEALMVFVTLENNAGETMQFEVADIWLKTMQLDEGDEWPDEIVNDTIEAEKRIIHQAEWMANFYEAIEEMDVY